MPSLGCFACGHACTFFYQILTTFCLRAGPIPPTLVCPRTRAHRPFKPRYAALHCSSRTRRTLVRSLSAIANSSHATIASSSFFLFTRAGAHNACSRRRFLANLKYIVIDEAHTYRGTFGSHVAMVLRRLLRCCAIQKAAASSACRAAERDRPLEPQVICCSATISNAREHFYSLFPRNSLQRRLCVVGSDVDGSPHGRRLVALWNPPTLPGEKEVEPSHWGNSDLTAQEEAALLSEAPNSDSASGPQAPSPRQAASSQRAVAIKIEKGPESSADVVNDPDAEPSLAADGVVAAVGSKFEPKGRQLPIVLWHATVRCCISMASLRLCQFLLAT